MQEIGERQMRHDCTENENHFRMNLCDGELEEIEVGNCLEREWMVIGFKDLCEGLRKAGYRVTKC